jgi:hypothetical protein
MAPHLLDGRRLRERFNIRHPLDTSKFLPATKELDLRDRKAAFAHQGIRVDIPAAEVAERFVGRH